MSDKFLYVVESLALGEGQMVGVFQQKVEEKTVKNPSTHSQSDSYS